MTLVATDVARLSNVLKGEQWEDRGWCRKVVSAYEASAQTYQPGSVLVRTLTSGSGTGAAVTGNTGNGTMGSVTVYPNARVGVYVLKVLAAASNAGVFAVYDPEGKLVGMGNVAAAFTDGGISFTLADGSTDFAAGDAFTITVTGTERYSLVAANSDLADVCMFISDKLGNAGSTAIAATTATDVVVLYRGPAIVADAALVYGSTVDTTAEKNAVKAALEAKGIMIATQI